MAPDSPILRAVSLTVPADRAVGGSSASASASTSSPPSPSRSPLPVDPVTGEAAAIDPETGEPIAVRRRLLDQAHVARRRGPRARRRRHRMSTSCAWTCRRPRRSPTPRTRVHSSPWCCGRTKTRATSTAAATARPTDTLLTRYNFRVPETIDGRRSTPQPIAFPTPFPNEPYLSPAPLPSPEP